METSGESSPEDTVRLAAENAGLLTEIRALQPTTLSSLTDALGQAKSTVNRRVNELETAGLVTIDDDQKRHQYSLTFLGQQTVDWLEDGQSLFGERRMYEDVPTDGSLPRWVVRQGTVDVASETAPAKHEVFDQILEFVSRSDRFHVVAPALTRDKSFFHVVEEVLTNDLSVELTFPESFMELLTTRFPDQLPELLANHDVEAFAFPDDVAVPYGFGLGYVEDDDGTVVDAEAAVVCYDDQHHNANGTVVNETPWAVTWAEQRYETYREQSDRWTDDIVEEFDEDE